MSQGLRVDFINRSCAEFRGSRGIREIYTQMFRRPPVYNTRTRSWSAPPKRVVDLAAWCEARGWNVTYTGDPQTASPPLVEQHDPGVGLW